MFPSERSLRRKACNSFRYGCSSGKRGFSDRGTAYLAMLDTNERMRRNGEEGELRGMYRCEECARYHLTSREK